MARIAFIFLAVGFIGGVWSERAADPFAANLVRALTLFAWVVWLWLRLVRVPREIDPLETYRRAGARGIVVENMSDKSAWISFDGPGGRVQRCVGLTKDQREVLTKGYDPATSIASTKIGERS